MSSRSWVKQARKRPHKSWQTGSDHLKNLIKIYLIYEAEAFVMDATESNEGSRGNTVAKLWSDLRTRERKNQDGKNPLCVTQKPLKVLWFLSMTGHTGHESNLLDKCTQHNLPDLNCDLHAQLKIGNDFPWIYQAMCAVQNQGGTFAQSAGPPISWHSNQWTIPSACPRDVAFTMSETVPASVEISGQPPLQPTAPGPKEGNFETNKEEIL